MKRSRFRGNTGVAGTAPREAHEDSPTARVNWVVLARHALQDEHGCLHICGIIDTFTVSKPPIRVPPFSVCFGVQGAPASKTTYGLTAIAPDGRLLTLAENQPLHLGERGATEQYVNVDGLTFPAFGHYRFQVHVGDTVAMTPLILTAPPSVS